MKKSRLPVTDHAIIRYLERVEGMDIEGLRRKIGHRVKRGIELGASGVVLNGVCYKLNDGVVCTVWLRNQPDKRTNRGRGKGGQ